ncbi:MAG: PASTA domain-containing protein [Actinobacteria bacterium]|nr:PASTA domain-containing protein [Actinomycetota bacterium]
MTSPPARPVTRDRPASRIRRRRRYKHQAQRPSKRRFHLGRWRPVVLAGALGAGAVLALFALFALSISVFLGAGTEGQGASTEPSPVQVERSGTPHLSGKTVEAAAAELRRAGLKLGEVTSAPSGSVAPDHILEQFPAGGTRVPRNTAVDVVVATEPAKG